MARFGSATRCLLLSFAAFLLASDSELIKAAPEGPGAAGVFLLLEGGRYAFNATTAAAACLSLGVGIATRAQMERAVRRGLQTCKFGWIAERIAVVPRLTAHEKCGNGKTGVVTWSVPADRKFGVFCFNASDFEETPNRSRVSPHSSALPPTPTQTSRPPASTPLRPATESPPSMKPGSTEAPEQTSFSVSTPLIQTTHSTIASSTFPTPPPPSSTHTPPPLSPLIASEPTVAGSVCSTPVTPRPTKHPVGNVLGALVVFGVVALLLAAAGVVWCYKLSIFTYRSRQPLKDDAETEMWKHTDSEVDLQSRHEGGEEEEEAEGGGEEEEAEEEAEAEEAEEEEEEEEEEEADRKYSSDVTLCATPDLKTNPSE